MIQSFSFQNDPYSELKTKIRQNIKLMLIGGFAYSAWTFIHFMVEQDSIDSYLERLAVLASFVGLIAITKLAKNMSLQTKSIVLKFGRWIMITHYFSIVARNEIAVHYAIPAYFLVFVLSSLFESPKYFFIFSLYVMALSFGCQSSDPSLPAYAFRLGLATCLIISFYLTKSRHKLIQQLKQSESTFRSVFETAGVGMDLCAQTLNAKEIQISIPPIPEDLFVQCRSIELSQVLLNLINNAHDAVKDLPPDRWIKFEISSSAEFVRVAISNSGPNISAELRDKLFNPFFTTKPIGQGTGLGLSISLGIMKSHHGNLTLDKDSSHTKFVLKILKGTASGEQKTQA